MFFKAALYMNIVEKKVRQTDLAIRLDVDAREIRRMLDPHHGTKLPVLEKALQAIGAKVTLSFS